MPVARNHVPVLFCQSPAHGCSSFHGLRPPGQCCRCAVTLNWDAQFKDHNTSRVAPVVRGRLGVAPLPGSTRVWNRGVDAVQGCTPALCPNATPLLSSRVAELPVAELPAPSTLSATAGAAAAPGGPPPLPGSPGPPGAPPQPLQLLNQPGFSAFPLDRIFYDTSFSLPEQSGGGIMLIKVSFKGSVSSAADESTVPAATH